MRAARGDAGKTNELVVSLNVFISQPADKQSPGARQPPTSHQYLLPFTFFLVSLPLLHFTFYLLSVSFLILASHPLLTRTFYTGASTSEEDDASLWHRLGINMGTSDGRTFYFQPSFGNNIAALVMIMIVMLMMVVMLVIMLMVMNTLAFI